MVVVVVIVCCSQAPLCMRRRAVMLMNGAHEVVAENANKLNADDADDTN